MSESSAGVVDTDVLVIGAGIAGLCAALAAAPRRVLILCRDEPTRSSSSALAQGGIAAAIGPADSIEMHVGDTLEAANHSADPEAVARVIGRGADAVMFLEACGVDFDRDGAGWSLHLEAGHRRARVVHAAGDRSGEAIVAALWARARASRHIDILSGWRALALLMAPKNGVAGVQAIDERGRMAVIRARETVLATGGIGQMFSLTTNGPSATGDGLAMALSIGARTAALEFVQFHPTALRVDSDPLPLLTEALRGAGARLITASGKRVMAGLHVLGDLAPRDIVARAVWEQVQAGDDVLLDATAIFSSAKAHAFPQARQTALRLGFDPAVTPLPVVAAAHYHMGGVVVDGGGRTTVPGLWACGEVSHTGLHGANRLASNSLLEAVVYGRALGAALAGSTCRARARLEPAPAAAHIDFPPESDPRWRRLRERMTEAMGPVRDGTQLSTALAATRADRDALRPGEAGLRLRYELAIAMLRAAAIRHESRGAHWRKDFPARDASRDGPGAVYSRDPGPKTRGERAA